jgi:HPt (histidine-containing phosphotransfer) domain-containing protein
VDTEANSPESVNIGLNFAIDGLDHEKGLKRFLHDEESYLNVLRTFAANTRSLLDIIRNVTQGNLSDYGTTVHGIKGSSLSIGADLAGDKAKDLEDAAKGGDFPFVQKNNPEFIVVVEKLLDSLDEMLDKIDAQTEKPRKAKPDTEIFRTILEACEVYDMATAEAAITELESYEYESGGEIVPWLKINIEQFNIDEVKEKLSGLI